MLTLSTRKLTDEISRVKFKHNGHQWSQMITDTRTHVHLDLNGRARGSPLCCSFSSSTPALMAQAHRNVRFMWRSLSLGISRTGLHVSSSQCGLRRLDVAVFSEHRRRVCSLQGSIRAFIPVATHRPTPRPILHTLRSMSAQSNNNKSNQNQGWLAQSFSPFPAPLLLKVVNGVHTAKTEQSSQHRQHSFSSANPKAQQQKTEDVGQVVVEIMVDEEGERTKEKDTYDGNTEATASLASIGATNGDVASERLSDSNFSKAAPAEADEDKEGSIPKSVANKPTLVQDIKTLVGFSFLFSVSSNSTSDHRNSPTVNLLYAPNSTYARLIITRTYCLYLSRLNSA